MNNLGKYYVYRHVRLDINIPFYIGIGTKYSDSKKYYKRSQKKYARSNFWKNITNKTKYRIDIIFESDDYDEIKKKEIYFIKLYGRKDLGTGSLVNLTYGGDGTVGYKCTEQAKEKIRNANIGKKYSQETKNKVAECSRETWRIRKESLGAEGYNKYIKNIDNNRKIKVKQFTLEGKYIKTFNSITEAIKEFKVISTANISACCNGKRPSAYKFIWRYENDNFDKYIYRARGKFSKKNKIII